MRQYGCTEDENALRGSAWGIELLVDRRSAKGLSGWATYSFGKTRSTDIQRHETFWGDFDQRHAVTLFGSYRLFDRSNVGVTYRAGTNFPIPGYLTSSDGALFIGSRRNEARLPTYSRLDVRADHQFHYLGRRVTLFAEVLNVLNRENLGLTNGVVLPTGEAVGFTDTLFPRRATAGLVIEF